MRCLPFFLFSLFFFILLSGCEEVEDAVSGADLSDVKKITITFNGNGGTLKDRTVQIYEGYPLPAAYLTGTKIPTKRDNKFTGWKEREEDEDAITAARTFSENTTLTAQWRALETFTITFVGNSGVITDASTTVQEDSVLPADYFTGAKIPTRTGYRFTGWKEGVNPVSALTKITSDMTLTAQWVWRLSVNFALGADTTGGGSSIVAPGTPPAAVTIDNNSALGNAYPRNDPSWTSTDPAFDYIFTGWFNGDTKYTSATPISVADGSTASFDLTAQWSRVLNPKTAAIPAIHPGSHFLEIGGVERTAKVDVDFTADGLFAMADDAGTLSSQWYRATSLTDATGTVIFTQTAAGTSTPNQLSLPFKWKEETAGEYWYWVIVTNTNNKATVTKVVTATTDNKLHVTVSE